MSSQKLIRIGNSRGFIVPSRLISKYNLDNGINITETLEGLLLKPASEAPKSFEERVLRLKKQKAQLYAQLKEEASDQDTVSFYANPENRLLLDIENDVLE